MGGSLRKLVVASGGIAIVAVAVGVAAVWVPRRPVAHGPNVLIVLWDTVRADHLSLYGYGKPTTPRLDAFAAEARVYEQAISPAMWTVPAHGSLFTGLPASSHGAKVGWLWLDGHHVTLAEHLRDAGYATFAWSSNPYLSEQTNLLQGFETVRYAWRGADAEGCAAATAAKLLPDDRSTELSPAWTPTGNGRGWPEHLVAYKDCAPSTVAAFLDWVDADRGGAPFFAYLNLLEAHHPRVPSARARAAVADPETVARALATDASLFRVMAAMEGHGAFTADELAAIGATYDATLWDLDDATGALIDGLRARGILDDTVVIVVSDHGENLGDNGMFDHRWDLHQTLVHVPLVVRYPRGVPPGREARPVSTGHLYGAILDWAGVERPAVDHPLPGLGPEGDVFTELEAPTPRLPEIRAAFPALDKDRWAARHQAVISGTYKGWRTSHGGWRLYDLGVDPAETTDRSAAEPEVAARLRQALVRWDRARPKVDPALRTAEDRPGNPLKAEPGMAEQLEALGYAEGEGDP